MSTARHIRMARRMSLGECDSFGRTEDDEDDCTEDNFDPCTEYDADRAADERQIRYEQMLDARASQ